MQCGYENCNVKILNRNIKRHTSIVHKSNNVKYKTIGGQEKLQNYFLNNRN